MSLTINVPDGLLYERALKQRFIPTPKFLHVLASLESLADPSTMAELVDTIGSLEAIGYPSTIESWDNAHEPVQRQFAGELTRRLIKLVAHGLILRYKGKTTVQFYHQLQPPIHSSIEEWRAGAPLLVQEHKFEYREYERDGLYYEITGKGRELLSKHRSTT